MEISDQEWGDGDFADNMLACCFLALLDFNVIFFIHNLFTAFLADYFNGFSINIPENVLYRVAIII